MVSGIVSRVKSGNIKATTRIMGNWKNEKKKNMERTMDEREEIKRTCGPLGKLICMNHPTVTLNCNNPKVQFKNGIKNELSVIHYKYSRLILK